MTTPEDSASTRQQQSDGAASPLSGLALFNLGVGLIASLVMLAAAGMGRDSLEKTALTFAIFVILLAVSSAMTSIWHGNISGDKADFKKAIGLTSWILTFVTLGFGVLMLLVLLIVVFTI